MIRWRRIVALCGALFAVLTPAAHAAPLGKVVLTSCDKDLRQATFEGRMTALRRAKMQLRFTLQASTPDDPRWRVIEAPGFETWITAPAGYGRYSYDKTVEDLLAPASYRAVVHFRWKDAHGRVVHSEKVTSATCRQPDSRPDLVVRELSHGPKGYVAVIANKGPRAAGAFDVDFLRAGEPEGTATVAGLEPGALTTVTVPALPCVAGEELAAIADPRAEVEESDEENNGLTVSC